MKLSPSVVTIAVLVAGSRCIAHTQELAPIPDSCPVTLPTEPMYVPPGQKSVERGGAAFLYGTDALFTQLDSDGRWRGIKSPTGTRNKSAWFRKNAEWRHERPYQLVVTAKRIDGDGPMLTVPRVTNMLVGKDQQDVAMLLMLELPERGCWEVTGNYKGDSLSFVVWVD